MTHRETCTPRPPVAVYRVRQTDKRPTALFVTTDRQTARCHLRLHIVEQTGYPLFFFSYPRLSLYSWLFSFCLPQHYCVIFITQFNSAFVFPSACLLFRGICYDVLASFPLFYAVVHLILRPVSIVFNPWILSFRPWAKQKKINHARTPGDLLISSIVSTPGCCQQLPPFPCVSRRGPFEIASRFYYLRSTTSFVPSLSKTEENQSSAHARSLPAIVLLISSIVSRPCRPNLHSVFGQEDGVSQGIWSDISSSWVFFRRFFASKVLQNGIGTEEEQPGLSQCTDERRGTPFCTRQAPACCAMKGHNVKLLCGEYSLFARVWRAHLWQNWAVCKAFDQNPLTAFYWWQKHRIWRPPE